MANEVYQLQVNGDPIKLGKGPDADDEFASIADIHYKTVSGFAYLDVVLSNSQEAVQIVFPVTSAFNTANWSNIIGLITQDDRPWPILGGWSQNLNRPLTGLLKNRIIDGTGEKHPFIKSNITFVWFNLYF